MVLQFCREPHIPVHLLQARRGCWKRKEKKRKKFRFKAFSTGQTQKVWGAVTCICQLSLHTFEYNVSLRRTTHRSVRHNRSREDMVGHRKTKEEAAVCLTSVFLPLWRPLSLHWKMSWNTGRTPNRAAGCHNNNPLSSRLQPGTFNIIYWQLIQHSPEHSYTKFRAHVGMSWGTFRRRVSKNQWSLFLLFAAISHMWLQRIKIDISNMKSANISKAATVF